MTTEQFWSLLENLPLNTSEVVLRQRLEFLEPEELVSFQAHFDDAHGRAFKRDLWAVAYIIDCGCGDDGFIDFRYGLIACGRRVFEAAVKDADTLADFAGHGDDDYIPNEAFGYVASQVYKQKTGKEMPREESGEYHEPEDENWDFDDPDEWAERLPRIWARFGKNLEQNF